MRRAGDAPPRERRSAARSHWLTLSGARGRGGVCSSEGW